MAKKHLNGEKCAKFSKCEVSKSICHISDCHKCSLRIDCSCENCKALRKLVIVQAGWL